VYGLAFGVRRLGATGPGFRVWGVGFGVWGLEFGCNRPWAWLSHA